MYVPTRKVKDYTGQVFGNMTAVRYSHHIKSGACYFFRCVCGSEKVYLVGNVKSGATNSCGCLRKESQSKSMKAKNSKLVLEGATKGFLLYVRDLPDRLQPSGKSVRRIECLCRRCNKLHSMDAARFINDRSIISCSCYKNSLFQERIDKIKKQVDERQNSNCYACKKTKPLADFYKRPTGRPFAECKECAYKRSRAWILKKRENKAATAG